VDKLAVKRGGGQNHRIGLYDMILIKDNHIDSAGSIPLAVQRARLGAPGLAIEVEARSLEDVRTALAVKVERILLDNMSLESMAEAVKMRDDFAKVQYGVPTRGGVPERDGVPLLEASGNVSLESVRRIAETGVDYISVGALTHSAKVFDVSFDYLG
jgi:nicotinate-nucleotide pyrophosphorylase (carboxylating)